MRIYDEPVDVQRGLVGGQEAPGAVHLARQTLGGHRLVSHWVGPAWWEQAGVAELLGVSSHDLVRASQDTSGPSMTGPPVADRSPDLAPDFDRRLADRPVATGPRLGADLLAERELWRWRQPVVRLARFVGPHASGVFDLCFDWAGGRWTRSRLD